MNPQSAGAGLLGFVQGFLGAALPGVAPGLNFTIPTAAGAAQGASTPSFSSLGDPRVAGQTLQYAAEGASWSTRIAGVAIGLVPILLPLGVVVVGGGVLYVAYRIATNPDTPGAIGSIAKALK